MGKNNSNPMKDSKIFQDTMLVAHSLYGVYNGKYHYEWSNKVASDSKLFQKCLDEVLTKPKLLK